MSKYTFEIPGQDEGQAKPLKVEALFFNHDPQFPALFAGGSSFVRVDGSNGAVQVYARYSWVTVGHLKMTEVGAVVDLLKGVEE